MPRKAKSVVKKAGSAIAKTTRKLTTKLRPHKRVAKAKKAPEPQVAKAKKAPEPQVAKPKRNPSPVTHTTQRTSDVPLDLLIDAYVPSQTGMKSSFRSDGADQQNDQEISPGATDRFLDEDHFTNKSGDARIGTHGRTSVPGEMRPPATR